ncbi:MAG: hypothetical protein GX898_09545 [Corynebacterium sp.]|nr:hypothetical protein [Corynebacterium sp.]
MGLLGSPIAGADTITADTDREMCIASENDTSGVVTFWEGVEQDVRDQRLSELDEQDPGIKDAIEAYIAEAPSAPSAAVLQTRLDALETGEGLAMLLPESTTDLEVVDPQNQQRFQTDYTYDEAKQIVADIPEEPAINVQTQLDQAAAASTRLAEIRAEVFSQRTEDYNQTQFDLRDDFQSCIDEIEDARPIPAQYLILGGAGILALAALGLRAWSNSRTPNRHDN